MSAEINDVSRTGCIIDVNLTVGDAGTYWLQIWDDGVITDAQSFAATTGQTLDVFYTIKHAAGTGAPGIGIVISDGPTPGAAFALVDPFIYPDDVANSCAAAFAGSLPCIAIPDGSVVGQLISPTEVFWAPGKISPDVSLSPTPDEQKFWVIGEDDSGQYYKIILSCQYVWVPVGTMAPAFDDPVWQGTPLPTLYRQLSKSGSISKKTPPLNGASFLR